MTVVFKLVCLSAEYIRYAFVPSDRSHPDMRSIAFQVFSSGTSLYGVRSIALHVFSYENVSVCYAIDRTPWAIDRLMALLYINRFLLFYFATFYSKTLRNDSEKVPLILSDPSSML